MDTSDKSTGPRPGPWALAAGGMVLALALGLTPADARADPVASGWQKLASPGPVIGLDGKRHNAACSGFPGTASAFEFWVKRGKSKDLVVYFEGGGACWNDFTCTHAMGNLPPEVPQFFVPAVPPGTDPNTFDGIFNLSHPANPVRDWSFVYIPYCTADVHAGSTDRRYFNTGHPVLPLPNDFNIHHGGFDNFMVVLDWMRKNAAAPERILVAGSSAGGYGASINFPWVQRAFPKARLSVLADASQGVLTPGFDISTPGRNSWNPQLPRWVFGNDTDRVPTPEVLRIAARANPETRVAQFSTRLDEVQIQFHAATLLFNGPGATCANPAISWNQQAVAQMKSNAADTRNYRHYLAEGSYHTILRSPQFFTEASAGRPMRDWTAALVASGDDDDKGRGGKAPSAWQNLACPGCLTPLPCP